MRASEFYKAAKAAIDPMVKPLGFRRRGRFYYRIVNDIVQQFCLFWLRFDFTVRFRVTSVYDSSAELIEGDEIYQLINGTNEWLGLRMVETTPGVLAYEGPCANPFHIDLGQCAQVCAGAVGNYLLPFFEGMTDAQSALRLLRERGLEICPVDWPEGVDSIRSLGFLLGMGEWERAEKTLKAFLDWPHADGSYWNMMWKLYDALEALDVSGVLSYMDEREAATYAELKWKRA